jgi:desulfoferrodoxin (superoxide reductase-like protein)
MLLKDMKSTIAEAASLRTIKAFASLLLLFMMALPVTAHPPSQVSIAYDSQNQSLMVTTTHQVSDPTSHYVFRIEVLKNGEKVITKEYTSQPTPSTFSYDYPLNASKGDIIKATAYCVIAGSRSAETEVG